MAAPPGKTKYTPQPGISSQWAEKGSYREANVVHFIKHNLRQDESAIEFLKWKVLAPGLCWFEGIWSRFIVSFVVAVVGSRKHVHIECFTRSQLRSLTNLRLL
jgi:hypothetical protein